MTLKVSQGSFVFTYDFAGRGLTTRRAVGPTARQLHSIASEKGLHG